MHANTHWHTAWWSGASMYLLTSSDKLSSSQGYQSSESVRLPAWQPDLHPSAAAPWWHRTARVAGPPTSWRPPIAPSTTPLSSGLCDSWKHGVSRISKGNWQRSSDAKHTHRVISSLCSFLHKCSGHHSVLDFSISIAESPFQDHLDKRALVVLHEWQSLIRDSP